MSMSYEIFRPFGPRMYKSTFNHIEMLEELCNEMRGKTDMRTQLAGNLNEEWLLFLKEDTHEPMLEELMEHCATWELSNRGLGEEIRDGLIETFELQNIWVNYQYTHDWNPPHNHGGACSFVIYIDNPVDFNKEDEYGNQKGNTPTSGNIQFRYGEQFIRSNQLYQLTPKRGDIIMFPNWLEHQVFPFMQPDIVRVSVAGNINIGD